MNIKDLLKMEVGVTSGRPQEARENRNAERKKGNIMVFDLPDPLMRIMFHHPQAETVERLYGHGGGKHQNGYFTRGKVINRKYLNRKGIEIAIAFLQLDALLDFLKPWRKACERSQIR